MEIYCCTVYKTALQPLPPTQSNTMPTTNEKMEGVVTSINTPQQKSDNLAYCITVLAKYSNVGERYIQADVVHRLLSMGFLLLDVEYDFQLAGADNEIQKFKGDLLFATPDDAVVLAVETAYRSYTGKQHNKSAKYLKTQACRAAAQASTEYPGAGVYGIAARNNSAGSMLFEIVYTPRDAGLRLGRETEAELDNKSWKPTLFGKHYPFPGSQSFYEHEARAMLRVLLPGEATEPVLYHKDWYDFL